MAGSYTEQTQAPNSVALPVSDLPVSLTYDGTILSTRTVEYRGVTYVQTYANNGSNITSISRWVAQ